VQNSQKNTGECFTTKLKSTCKNLGTFEEKNFTQKSRLRLSCTKPFNSSYIHTYIYLYMILECLALTYFVFYLFNRILQNLFGGVGPPGGGSGDDGAGPSGNIGFPL